MKLLLYPTIFTEYNDEDGHYFVVTTPDIPGMVTEGNSLDDAATEAVDAIATMLDGEAVYPTPSDPAKWQLTPQQRIVYITVDMAAWYQEKATYWKAKTVRVNITVPEYLRDAAKVQEINISKVATDALTRILQV
ncbi:MAG: type II toxin-antitoxin system HicB family antitoxin [Loigolactobacillus coryniformis]|jgi:predicted RNase H-like HicB family nuclease|uniref:type II toxin-antitoxin system HicB family antitoxin n=1 Tax=Loigolactobacillus coryniformis TaxID=1610 RepID=UPI0026478D83|nr:type II toxin-antitoxin system HicB family antitoxin [Loigolactobacillus coryniformis]MDN5951137.1 type II toxin-antitoxin system HicB family antitoxin [Loigolactobacillus coryniformis]MDN5953046.1 type II toxin-antitoxin system HicB family antitoxin [Loigolactobacillus coryniformis]